MRTILPNFFRTAFPWVMLLLLPVVILACSNAKPTLTPAIFPTQLSPEELRSLAREAVADSIPETAEGGGLTEEELQSLVERAVADSIQPSLTAEDIEDIVAVAIASATAPGVTLQDVEDAISNALSAQSAESPSEVEVSDEPLVIYSGRSESLVDAIIQQFHQTSEIEVEVKYAGTSQLAAAILEEGDNSPTDIYFAQDPGGLGAVQDLLSVLPDEVVSKVPEWARSPDGTWVGLSGRARTVVYNPERVSEDELPDDIWEFVNPEWKDRIGWAPTNASFQAMITAMHTLWGEEKTKEWLLGVQANNPTIYPKNTPQVAAVAAGEIDVGLVNYYYLFRFLAEEGEDFPARNYHPRAGGPGATIMVAGAGILETSENKEAAVRFLEFMLSRVGQQYFAGQTFEYPLVDGVNVPHVLVPLEEIDHPNISLKDLADLEGTHRLLRETGILP